MTKKVRKAVFPVGGKGIRFLPATKALPKEMLPIVDKPLIQYAVEEARAAGIEEFIFVTGRGKTAIADHFDRSAELEALLAERGNTRILSELEAMMPGAGAACFIRQPYPLGLGHAVWCARNYVGDEPFAILLADDMIYGGPPALKQMIEAYDQVGGGNVIAAMEVPPEHTHRYGIIAPGKDDGKLVEIKGLVEKPSPNVAPSNIAVIGRYILDPQVFDLLSTQEKGAGGEIQLTDAMAKMIGHKPFHGLRYDGTRYDCGDKAGFIQATIAVALDRHDIREPVKAFLAKQKF